MDRFLWVPAPSRSHEGGSREGARGSPQPVKPSSGPFFVEGGSSGREGQPLGPLLEMGAFAILPSPKERRCSSQRRLAEFPGGLKVCGFQDSGPRGAACRLLYRPVQTRKIRGLFSWVQRDL